MQLSTRLVVAYGYLVVLAMVVAGSATVGFFDLGGGIERILRDNVASVRSTTQILEALERQDSATLTTLMNPSEGRQALSEADAEFQEALEEAAGNITSEEERGIIERLRQNYDDYTDTRAELLDTPQEAPLEAYQARTFPKFQTVKQDVLALLDKNHSEMVEADERARQKAIQYGSWLGFLVVVALASFVFMTRGLRRLVLARIDDIQDVAQAVAEGSTGRRVRVQRDDELGVIAREFNNAIDRHDELKRNIEGQSREIKQQLLGVLKTLEDDAALFGLDGQLVASTFTHNGPESTTRELGRVVAELETPTSHRDDPEEPAAASPTTVELADGREARLELVRTAKGRLVGWLARVNVRRSDN